MPRSSAEACRLSLPARARARAAALRLPALWPMQACHGPARPRLHAPARAQAQQRTLSPCADMGAGIGQHPLCSLVAASAEPRVPASLPARPLEPTGRPEACRALSGTLASGNSAGTSAGTSADHPPSLLRAPRHAHQITFVSMLYGVSRTFRNDASSHRPPSRSTHSLRLLSSALPQVPLISFGASRSTVSRSPVRPILLLSPQSSSRPFSPSLFSRVRLLASASVRCTCLVRFVPLVPHIHT